LLFEANAGPAITQASAMLASPRKSLFGIVLLLGNVFGLQNERALSVLRSGRM
jgi:hypothetical protein